MRKILTVTGMICALVYTSGLAAQSSEKPQTKTGAQATDKAQSQSPDAAWMREVAMDGMAEVEHGRTATTNAQNDEVRKFGQRMVDDHTKANEELKGLASKKGVDLPTDMGPKHRAMQQKLEKMKGQEFDRAYMNHMVVAHKQAVAAFQREAKSGKDGDARAWAEKTLPALQEHLKMATDLAARAGKK